MNGVKRSNDGVTLRKCPFCGGTDIKSTWLEFSPVLKCDGCGSTMTLPASFRGNYKIELERKWNTRKPVERILERLEEEKGTIFDENGKVLSQEDYFIDIDDAIKIIKEEVG